MTSRIHLCALEETEGTGAQGERTLSPFVAPQTVPRGLLVWASQRTDYDLDLKKKQKKTFCKWVKASQNGKIEEVPGFPLCKS